MVHALKTAKQQHAFENQLLQSRLEAQEQSHRYFSEEIHDNIGQILSTVGWQLYLIQAECQGEHGKALVQQSTELLNKAINDLRAITHRLSTGPVGKAGLVDILQKEIAFLSTVRPVECRLEVDGDPRELADDRQMLLFRILQEAITRALKQASATAVTVLLRYTGATLTAAVFDNGVGRDDGAAPSATPGYAKMELRARLLGGVLQINQKPGQGTILSVTIDT